MEVLTTLTVTIILQCIYLSNHVIYLKLMFFMLIISQKQENYSFGRRGMGIDTSRVVRKITNLYYYSVLYRS